MDKTFGSDVELKLEAALQFIFLWFPEMWLREVVSNIEYKLTTKNKKSNKSKGILHITLNTISSRFILLQNV
jgi:hypothetical protein